MARLAPIGRHLASALAFALWLSPSSAWAQEDEARVLFQRGAEAYADERYAEALEAFEASYRAREVPVVLFNLAQTLRALDRPAEAIEAYRRYLRTDSSSRQGEPATDPELDDARRAAVEAVVAELSPRVSFVRLEVFPDGAEVLVDGRSLGVAPFEERVAVDPGSRRFEARAEGHLSATRLVELAVGEPALVRLALREAPPSGTLRLRANVAGAEVRVDREVRGVTLADESLELRLSVGRHELSVEADGFRAHEGALELARDEVRELDVVLERRPSLVEQWWLWTAVGGAVVVGVVVALAVALSGGAQPLEGTLPTVEALWAR